MDAPQNTLETRVIDPTEKMARAEARIALLDGAVVALSGGVDSSLLLALAARALPPDKLVAVTAVGPVESEEDMGSARALTDRLELSHECIVIDSLEVPGFADNTPLRCYLCRGQLYEVLERVRQEHSFEAVLDGAIAEDSLDYRPGLQAAKEAGVLHPLAEAGFSKEEVRAASRLLGLATAERPASPCLASRFPYGEKITAEALETVARAESLLHGWGFPVVRVRHHGHLARIEVPGAEVPRLTEEPLRSHVVSALRGLGYAYVTIDLVGFRSGSLNEVLGDQPGARSGTEREDGPRRSDGVVEGRLGETGLLAIHQVLERGRFIDPVHGVPHLFPQRDERALSLERAVGRRWIGQTVHRSEPALAALDHVGDGDVTWVLREQVAPAGAAPRLHQSSVLQVVEHDLQEALRDRLTLGDVLDAGGAGIGARGQFEQRPQRVLALLGDHVDQLYRGGL